ncbi:hypothetical protein TNCV_2754941 [Trichonephila clavipes]|nr:hypothetical protein TNCV_2754941 [Trichonephila clavipes]
MHVKSVESSNVLPLVWCDAVNRREWCLLRCRPRHLIMVKSYKIRRQKPSHSSTGTLGTLRHTRHVRWAQKIWRCEIMEGEKGGGKIKITANKPPPSKSCMPVILKVVCTDPQGSMPVLLKARRVAPYICQELKRPPLERSGS